MKGMRGPWKEKNTIIVEIKLKQKPNIYKDDRYNTKEYIGVDTKQCHIYEEP